MNGTIETKARVQLGTQVAQLQNRKPRYALLSSGHAQEAAIKSGNQGSHRRSPPGVDLSTDAQST